MTEKLLRIEDVAIKLGCSIYTINLWYKFKQENPDHELVKYLPDYIQENPKAPKYWQQQDIKLLKKFKELKPRGRYGIMASVTQKYVKKEK